MSDNEHEFRRIGVDYAQIGRNDLTTHHNFAREIITTLKKFDRRRGTLQELSEYWKNAPGQTLVLSSELFEDAESHQIAEMRNVLAQSRTGETFRIVLILRDLIDLLPSSYAQKVKFGVKTHDFDAFFDERMLARRVHYFDTAQRWANVFGWDNLRLRLLDRKYLFNGDLLDDFMTLCGVSRDILNFVPGRRDRQANTSPGWRVLEAARALFDGRYQLTPGRRISTELRLKDKQHLGNLLIRAGNKWGWNEDKGRYLTRSQAEYCLHVFRTNLEKLNKLSPELLPLPTDLENRNFHEREFLPDADRIPEQELRAFYEEVRELKSSGSKRSFRRATQPRRRGYPSKT